VRYISFFPFFTLDFFFSVLSIFRFSSFCWSHFLFLRSSQSGWLGDLPSKTPENKERFYNFTSFFLFDRNFSTSFPSHKNSSCFVSAKLSLHSILWSWAEQAAYWGKRYFFFISLSILLFLALKKRQSTLSSLYYTFSTSLASVMSPLQLKNSNHIIVSPHHLEVSFHFQSFVLCLWTSFRNGVNKTHYWMNSGLSEVKWEFCHWFH